MAKLNQIIAIEKDIKSKAHSAISDLYKRVQKPDLFHGFTKTYQPVNEDDTEKLPPESKRVQLQAGDVMKQTALILSELMDVTIRKDRSNCVATADVRVGDTLIIEKAPVTYLLFMEKQLTDLRTLIEHLPTLDEGDEWTRDPNTGLQRSSLSQTHRTKKTQKPIVLYQATPEHPAQTQLLTEDVLVGHWHQTKLSGAMPRLAKQALCERVEKLLLAVKQAREEANNIPEATSAPVGPAVFGYLLQDA